ncbi:MAG: hypothetical protein HY823_00440 [Acidobacteria bacterium]|nr:hypothetical protein [Acidobacteriota bacterium]
MRTLPCLLCLAILGASFACGSGSGGPADSAPAPDFSLSAGAPPAIQAGNSVTTVVSAARTNGHRAAISLGLEGNPQGITGSGGIALDALSGSLAITVPSGVAAGGYTLTVAGNDGSLPSRKAVLAVAVTAPPPPAGSTESAFGIYGSHGLHPKFQQATGLGDAALFKWSDGHMETLQAHWTRFSLLAAWSLVEPVLGGGYNWKVQTPNGAPDTILGAVYAPGNDIHAVLNIQALSLEKGLPSRSPFTHPAEYAAFLKTLAARYGGGTGSIQVNHFQLGNEMQDWFDRGLTAEQYGEAARITLEALRSVNPKAQLVMLGGFERGTILEDRYKQAIKALKSQGVKPLAIDIHWWFWPTGGCPWQSSAIPDARKFLDSQGFQDVQIWSMENGGWVGCPSGQPVQTEQDQARLLVKRFVWGRANGLDKLFWQQLLDLYNFDGKPDSFFNSAGLVDDGEQNCSDPARRNTERIAYWSYRKLALETDNLVASPAGALAGIHDGTLVFAYDYLRKDGSHRYILWRENGIGNISLPVPGSSWRATNLVPDRFGVFQETLFAPKEGHLSIQVGPDPVLLSPAAP